jgi:hypothetical protein
MAKPLIVVVATAYFQGGSFAILGDGMGIGAILGFFAQGGQGGMAKLVEDFAVSARHPAD